MHNAPENRTRVDTVASVTDFLLARLEEDEAGWLRAKEKSRASEIAAKRRIVEQVSGGNSEEEDNMIQWVIRVLALPYASHPDYQPEWGRWL